MPDTRTIIDRLGADAMASALGVSDHMIRHARTAGTFPASWFAVVSEMCSREGMTCPPALFNFKRSQNTGDAASPAQPEGPEYRTNGDAA